jgi:hypothetical protein
MPRFDDRKTKSLLAARQSATDQNATIGISGRLSNIDHLSKKKPAGGNRQANSRDLSAPPANAPDLSIERDVVRMACDAAPCSAL